MSDDRPFLIQWRDSFLVSNLSSPARLVAFVLSTHMNARGGSCFPSIRRLATETGYAPNTVMAAVDELEDAGFVQLERGGGRRANRYHALIPNVSASETNATASNGNASAGETPLSQPLRVSVFGIATEDAHEDAQVGRSTDVSPNGDTSAAPASRRGTESEPWWSLRSP